VQGKSLIAFDGSKPAGGAFAELVWVGYEWFGSCFGVLISA
jgi:hypothetical protein